MRIVPSLRSPSLVASSEGPALRLAPPLSQPPRPLSEVRHAPAEVPSHSLHSLVGAARSVLACAIGAALGLGLLLPSAGAVSPPAPTADPQICEVHPDPDGRLARIAARPYGADARRLAREALDIPQRPSGEHPYLRLKRDVERRLDRLGLLRPSSDHLHVSDVDLEHGAAVLRSALGLRPLVRTETSTLSVANVPMEFAMRTLRPDQAERFRSILSDAFEEMPPPPTTLAQVLSMAQDELEFSVVQKTLRLALLREQRGEVSGHSRIFVNMSFGQSPERIAAQMAMAILMAPPGTELHRLATRTLGERPVQLPPEVDPEMVVAPDAPCDAPDRQRWWARGSASSGVEVDYVRFERQFARLKKHLAYPELKRVMAGAEYQQRLGAARSDFEQQLLGGRREGILVFEAAGNEHSDAKAAGDPQMSDTTASGLLGLIRVGAIDIRRASNPGDDRVADFSGAGPVTISAPGVRIPVWLEDGAIGNTEGTSFASPIAMEMTAAAAAVAPHLTVDQLAQLLEDPRVTRNIRGTDRDGRGSLDPFALVLVAANPNLDRATIHWAWDRLGRRDADLAEIKARLGLPADPR